MKRRAGQLASDRPRLAMTEREPDAYTFAAWMNVTIIHWPRQATGPAVRKLFRFTDRMVSEHPEGISNIHIIDEGAGLPTPEARSGFVAMMEQHAAKLACVGIVLEGGGFWASTLRSVITGMRMISPRSFGMRIHSNVNEMVEWLSREHLRRTHVELSVRDLLHAIALTRAPGVDEAPRERVYSS